MKTIRDWWEIIGKWQVSVIIIVSGAFFSIFWYGMSDKVAGGVCITLFIASLLFFIFTRGFDVSNVFCTASSASVFITAGLTRDASISSKVLTLADIVFFVFTFLILLDLGTPGRKNIKIIGVSCLLEFLVILLPMQVIILLWR